LKVIREKFVFERATDNEFLLPASSAHRLAIKGQENFNCEEKPRGANTC